MADDVNWGDASNVIPWRVSQRAVAIDYLEREGFDAERLRLVPEWELPPHSSLWFLPPDVWVFAGNHPTDYIRLPGTTALREVLLAVGRRWFRAAENMMNGREDPEITIGDPSDHHQQQELGELLLPRAKVMLSTAENDDYWAEDE